MPTKCRSSSWTASAACIYEEEDIFYYITLMNENYEMPILPIGTTEGICRGMYRLAGDQPGPKTPQVRLLGSGAILRESLRAKDILAEKFGVSSNVYSVTSYKALCQDAGVPALEPCCTPGKNPASPMSARCWPPTPGPIVAALDYVSAVATAIAPWVGPDYTVLGTDGFGRSEARRELRRFFEVDAENIALAAIAQLAHSGQFPQAKLAQAIKTLGLDPNKPNPATAG